MKFAHKIFFLVAAIALLLLPWQSALAYQGQDGPSDDLVIVGRSYVLQSGENLPYGLTVIGGSATIQSGASVNGDLVVIGGSATVEVESTVKGEMLVVGGTLNLATTTENNVVIIGGPAKLAETAHIRGDLVTMGGALEQADGAQIDGNIVDNPRPPQSISGWAGEIINTAQAESMTHPWTNVQKGFTSAFILALVAAGLAAFLPEHISRVSSVVATQTKSAIGFGILALISLIVAIVVLVILSIPLISILLTFPAGFLALLAFTTASAFGWIVIGAELGNRLVTAFHREWPLPATAALGVFLLTLGFSLVETLPNFGVLGNIAEFIVSLIGIGAVAMTRFGTRFYTVETVATMAQEPIPPAA